ncbi:tetratricopeptide repeat protein [Paraburkholderia strydomiana]|uniref:hypothetical protein n=1 Tax=Paraburkholderia strydomiana TaxID=1245417 RepID=UPI0038B6F1E5
MRWSQTRCRAKDVRRITQPARVFSGASRQACYNRIQYRQHGQDRGDLDEKTRAQLDAAIRGEQKTQRLLAEIRVEYKKAIGTIQALANQINAGPREKEAAQALAAGNSAPSEALLQDEEKGALKSAGKDAVYAEKPHKEAAELARQRGALAFLTDKRAALNAYLTAATYDPADVKTQIFLGDLQNFLGDSKAAKDTFVNAASIAEANLRIYPDQVDASRKLAISTYRIGESLEKQGDLPGAVARYQQALALLDPLAKRAPDDMPLQIDLAESRAILGSALRDQGDRKGRACVM